MQHLQHTLIALVFLITATTYSQVALAPSAPNSSENYKVTAAYQGPSMLVYNKTTSKKLKSGYYFWNGKQWEVYDTSISAPDTGLASATNTTALSSATVISQEPVVGLR